MGEAIKKMDSENDFKDNSINVLDDKLDISEKQSKQEIKQVK